MKCKYLDFNETNKHATREAFGESLLYLSEKGYNVVAVDGDLTGSTTTKKLASKESYKNRLVNVGIAEQNMIDVAAGLSLTGNIAYTGSFAVFGVGRCYDQIRNTICYSNLNVKICPTHAGISVGPDGGSHQMIEDIALTTVLPNMKVIVPSDYNSAKAAFHLSAEHFGPMYIRMGRAKLPQIYSEDVEMKLGGSYTIKEGSDVTLVCNGIEVAQCIQAAKKLEDQGINCEVIDAYSVKPLDKETIVKSAKKTKRVVVCEEHSIYGGLCSVVGMALQNIGGITIKNVAINDKFGTSGEFEELLNHYNLDDNYIVSTVQSII